MRKHLVSCALLGALLVPATATAADAATTAQAQAAAAKGAAWIRGQQQLSGSLGGFGGDWSLSALAAAGVSAADVRVKAGAASAQDYYQGLWAGSGPGGAANDAARATLAAWGGGIQPSRVSASLNLVSRIASFSDGTQIGQAGLLNDDIFGTLALHRAAAPQALVRVLADRLAARRTPDGGFNWSASSTVADADTTGAALAALCAGGRGPGDPVVAGALAYLRGRQNAASGGFGTPDFGVNTDTTAWVVAGLNACGIDPNGGTWTTAQGKTPDDFLLAQQNADGSFQWRPGDRSHNLYSTQGATRSLAGAAFSAPPAASSSGALFRAAPAVAPGTSVPLSVVVDLGGSGVRMCEVRAAVGAPVGTLLDSAVAGDVPASCVTSLSRDASRVLAVNGVSGTWTVQRNGAPAALADAVGLGDLVFLTR